MKCWKLILIALAAFSLGSRLSSAQSCDCIDETPPGGRSCSEREARGDCSRRWMKRGGYCSSTCGFCQCRNEDYDSDCASCDDIAPDGQFSCAQQRDFGKCDESWMKPFCRKTCGRCNCSFGFDDDNIAFVGVGSDDIETRSESKPIRNIENPLQEVLMDDDGMCEATVFDTLSDAQQFTLLVEIVKTAQLDSILKDQNLSVTIFAPVNEAFGDLAAKFGMTLDVFVQEYPEKVKELIQYHVVPRPILDSREIGDAYSLDTLVPGKALYGSSPVEIDGIGSSAIVIQDGVRICKSVIYTIDEVLLPGSNLDEIGPVVVEIPVPQAEVPDCNANRDVMSFLSQDPELALFTEALKEAKVDSTLENEDKGFTVFAPTDEAIQSTLLEEGLTFKELLRDRKKLQSILNYHIVNKDLDSESLKSGKVKTLGGDSIVLAVENSGVEIAGVGSSATVVEADVDDVCTASIHKIDALLLPFEVSGEVYAVDGEEEKPMKEEEKSCNSIAHVLSRSSNLRVLNSAAQAAGLMSVFADQEQKLTIFAPTDTAFYTTFLDPESQEFPSILTDTESLISLLSYHTLDRPLPFSRLRPGTKVNTQLGSKEDGDLKLNVVKRRLSPTGKILRGMNGSAAIVQKNIVACNSVIHLIDAVLLPFDLKNNTKPVTNDTYYSKLTPAT